MHQRKRKILYHIKNSLKPKNRVLQIYKNPFTKPTQLLPKQSIQGLLPTNTQDNQNKI